jgi:hypothetical protein
MKTLFKCGTFEIIWFNWGKQWTVQWDRHYFQIDFGHLDIRFGNPNQDENFIYFHFIFFNPLKWF